MATAYSSEVSVSTYNRIRIKCDYSGTSASLTVQFRRTSSYTGTWYDSTATLTFNGQDKSSPYSYTGTVSTSWVDLVTVSGYTISASGGTYNWSFNNYGGGVLGCSGTITLQAQSSAPTGLRLENLVSLSEGFTADVVIDSWGTGATSSRYKQLQVWTYDASALTSPNRITTISGENLSDTVTASNFVSDGTLDIVGNTQYTLAACANNGTASTGNQRWTNAATLPYKPAVQLEDVTKTSAVFSISVKADGGFYKKTLFYSLDGANWQVFDSVESGNATTLSLVVGTGLSAGQSYTLRVKIVTDAGEISADNTAFTMSADTLAFYGSNTIQRATEVDRFYASDNSTATNVIKMYGSVNGEASLVFKNDYRRTGHPNLPPTPYGRVYYKNVYASTVTEVVELQSATEFESLCSTGSSAYNWTATVGATPVTLSSRSNNCIVGIEIGTEITSIPDYFLYGCSYFYGDLIVPDSVTTVGAYFASRCGNSSNKLNVVNLGKNVTSLGIYCLYSSYFESDSSIVTMPGKITAVPNYFMYYAYGFNSPLTISPKATSIGTYFLSYCTAFNSTITFNPVLTTIGTRFLDNSTAFNRDIKLPNTLTSIGTYFLYRCNSMVSTLDVNGVAATAAVTSNYTLGTSSNTAAMYTTGVKIAGSTRADWIARFPDRTSSPYRKLLNAGY